VAFFIRVGFSCGSIVFIRGSCGELSIGSYFVRVGQSCGSHSLGHYLVPRFVRHSFFVGVISLGYFSLVGCMWACFAPFFVREFHVDSK
jgi:hypothetical protein